MSLEQFGQRLEAGDVDEALRAHLRGCDECRAHYDALALAARALGDDGGAGERERLLRALSGLSVSDDGGAVHESERVLPGASGSRDGAAGAEREHLPVVAAVPSPRAQRPSRAVRVRVWAGLVGAALAAGLALFNLRQLPEPEVGLRGGAASPAPAWSLRLYGKDEPGKPVRLLADFPGSKEAAVGGSAELQYFVKLTPGARQTVLVETKGVARTVSARLEGGASAELSAVGEVFSAGSLGAGRAEVCTVVTHRPFATLRDALRHGEKAECGTLVVTP